MASMWKCGTNLFLPFLYIVILVLKSIGMTHQVNFLSKLVALRPGKSLKKIISNVMHGKDEGADIDEDSTNTQQRLGGISGRVSSNFLHGLY